MKARFNSSFERGRDWVRHLMFGAILCGLAAFFFTQKGSVPQVILLLLSFAMLVGMVIAAYRMCRCPYCGKRIIAGALSVKCCPACGRDLSSGKRVKKTQR